MAGSFKMKVMKFDPEVLVERGSQGAPERFVAASNRTQAWLAENASIFNIAPCNKLFPMKAIVFDPKMVTVTGTEAAVPARAVSRTVREWIPAGGLGQM